MANKEDFTFHRPLSMRVYGIGHIPHERNLPTSTYMTINLNLDRAKALELRDYLTKELAQEWMEIIRVEITGPSP
jgi:hypothetical protein